MAEPHLNNFLLNRLAEMRDAYPDRLPLYHVEGDVIGLVRDIQFIKDQDYRATVETHNQHDYVVVVGDGYHYYLLLTQETRALLV